MITQSKFARVAAIAVGAAIVFVMGQWLHFRWEVAWPAGAAGYLIVRGIGWWIGDGQNDGTSPDINTSN
jgi:ABC-type xylose transport system permease subunit